MAPVLARNFERVLSLTDGTAEGGDVLTTPTAVFIGASARTSSAGAAELVSLLAEIGQRGIRCEDAAGRAAPQIGLLAAG